MARSKDGVEFNESFFEDILRSSEVEAVAKGRAERIANKARSTAPTDSGEYAAGIRVTSINADKRTVFVVEATAPHSMAVEARTGNLARANKAVK